MSLSHEFLEELELLNLFNLDSSLEGLKIHHQAAPERIASAKRLHSKDMITLEDGGYLTTLGIEAAEHAQALVRILQTDG
ncbi:MAG: TIGR02647 family protein [SAR86 cluster bacterium]|uniref:TIGR02647 family protein n=1 Tax=SAR86 cluster bacterium TaxID=2030880 RepID=A0A2A5BB06_9GAMM|nr:MAG: TIGR02647 family protein [SAR86 cluster bacterium]